MRFIPQLVATLSFFQLCHSAVLDYEQLGAIPDDESYESALYNGNLLNETLVRMIDGDTFLVPNKTYTLMGGIMASGLKNVVFQIEGTLKFSDDRDTWPKNSGGGVMVISI